MLNPRRNGAFAAVVVTALALLVPSSAFAGHDLGIYKAEAHVDLNADEQTTSVSCNPGDHALDGMWRIDHADQDDYVAPLDLIAGAVDVVSAGPTSDSTYSFVFEKNAIGRAQVKIWVTCLANKTQGGSHQHTLSSGFVNHLGAPATAIGGYDSQTQTVTGTGSLVNTTFTTGAASCPSGTMLVSPGYIVDPATDITDGTNPADASPGMMRLFESDSSNTRDWTWQFENSALPAGYQVTITTLWRCLKIKLPVSGFDKHKYVKQFKTSTFNPDPSSVSEARLNCGDHYKGIVGGFAIPSTGGVATAASDGTGLISPPANASAFNNVFYLGMDPRIKQRAFRFVNRGSSASYNVALSLLCINYRTT
jgi:hypothetical protein